MGFELPFVIGPEYIAVALFGVVIGIIFGAIPGMTATMAVAVFLPLTYAYSMEMALYLLLGLYVGGISGGLVPAILINIPGTPSSVCTTFDGHPMALRGEGERALKIGVTSSFMGGMISLVVLALFTPILAGWAIKFSAVEKFLIILFALTVIAALSRGQMLRGLWIGMLGVLVAMMNQFSVNNEYRMVPEFLESQMQSGFQLFPVLIGLFAITEIMAKARDMNKATGTAVKVEKEKTRFRDVLKYKMVLLKSSILGVFIGAVPGTGAAISSFLAYNEAKRTSKHPEEYGHGSEEAVVASESANNAVTGATLIPLLTLGIPGDAVTAILIGSLTMYGMQPGIKMFTENVTFTATIMILMLLANVVFLIFGLATAKISAKVLNVSQPTVWTAVCILCVVGSFALNNTFFDVGVMFAAGVLGFFLKVFKFPNGPFVLGLLLGSMLESNMRRALVMSHGSWATFVTRPVSCVLFIAIVLTFCWPVLKAAMAKKKAAAQAK